MIRVFGNEDGDVDGDCGDGDDGEGDDDDEYDNDDGDDDGGGDDDDDGTNMVMTMVNPDDGGWSY